MKVLYPVLLSIFLVVSPVFAEPTIIETQPSTFFFTTQPGDIIENTLRISNNGGDDITVVPDATAIEVSDSYGHIRKSDPGKWSAHSWMKLEREKYDIKPGKTVFIPVTVEVPQAAEPGSYTAAITIRKQSEKISSEVGTVFYVNVGKQNETELIIQSFYPDNPQLFSGPQNFNISFINKGDHFGQAVSQIKILGIDGREAEVIQLPSQLIQPGKELQQQVPITQNHFGIYTVEATLHYANGTKRAFDRTLLFSIPLVVPIVIAVLAIWILRSYIKRKRHGKKDK